MPGLNDSQTAVLSRLFSAASDSAVRSLEQALSGEAERGGAMAAVYDLAAKESGQRRVRCAIFGPVVPLCRPSDSRAIRFPRATVPLLWQALRAHSPQLAAEAERVSHKLDNDHAGAQSLYDSLCAVCAEGLRAGEPDFAPVIALLTGAGEGLVEQFACCLDLAPVTRAALERLPEWIGRLNEERAAAARVFYKDAVALAEDAGPRYFEILFAHLPEPWQILRVMSAVMDRPSDRYAAVSELARFGEYILEDIERRLEAFNAFDPNDGAAAGVAAAETIHIAALQIAELETSIEMSRDGPWGVRLVKLKQALAQSAETRLGQIEKAIDIALPQQMVRIGKGRRGQPSLSSDPDAAALLRVEGLLGFFDHSRASAGQSGYGAARAKLAEKLEARLDQYVEDLLDMLHAEDPIAPVDRIHAFLEICARFSEMAVGEKAGQIVRRRAAAA